MTQIAGDVSVIICAYTEERWDELLTAVKSVQLQNLPPREIIVVVDHNPILLKWAQEHIAGVILIENQKSKGLSGARNSGAAIAQGTVVAFLDDDAVAEANWIEQLTTCYIDTNVVGVGGKIKPHWPKMQPSWFPEEFNWVIGCTYRGMPAENARVRNVIGANMSVRRHVLMEVGGFRESFGCNYSNNTESGVSKSVKWLQHRAGDEETEFCIRVGQFLSKAVWLYTPSASVHHCVAEQRTRWRYFIWRCYDEGLGKAILVKMHGIHTGLSSERNYTFKILPMGVMRGLNDALIHHDITGLGRATAILLGLAVTTVGYLVGNIFLEAPKPGNFSDTTDVLQCTSQLSQYVESQQ